MRYRLTLVSSNKTIPVTTSSRETCPTSCPLMGNGCYAEHGPIASVWRRTTEQGVDFNTLLAMIRRIPRGALWRWAQAGDLPGAGDDIDRQQLKLLTAANRGRPIAFTHKPTPDNLEALREAEAKGSSSISRPTHPAVPTSCSPPDCPSSPCCTPTTAAEKRTGRGRRR